MHYFFLKKKKEKKNYVGFAAEHVMTLNTCHHTGAKAGWAGARAEIVLRNSREALKVALF
jgi:hypothetical protein